MVFFTLFIVLPTEEICTLRRITSGVTVNEIKSRLELSAGLHSQIYHLSSRGHHTLSDDYVLELHHNVWSGFLYRAEVKDKWRPLFEAVIKGDVDWLLRQGRVCMTSDDIYHASNKNMARLDVVERGCVGLYLASWLGSSQLCQNLLSAGVNPNGATRNKRTPLFAAVARDNFQVVNILLNHGAKLYVKDCNGDTPLDIARRNSSKQCMKRILSAQNISVHNLNATYKSPNTETDTLSSQVSDEACIENTAPVLFPKQRPFTSHERAITVRDNTLQVMPRASLSRRSVRFNMENGHSLRGHSDRTQLPDVHLRTSNAYVRSLNGVSFRAQRPQDTRMSELLEGITLRTSLAKSAPDKSWGEIKAVGTWNGPTTALELLCIRSVVRKQKPSTQFGHSDFDFNTAIENKQSDGAKKIDLGTSAISFTTAENEQCDGAKNIDLEIPAPRLTTAQNEQSDVAKNTELDIPVLRPTTAHNEHSYNTKDVDCNIPAPNFTTAETGKCGVARKIDLDTHTVRLTTVHDEESYNAKDINCNAHAPNITTAETEQSAVAKELNRGFLALNLATAQTDQSDNAKDKNCNTTTPNITTTEIEQSYDAKEIDLGTRALKLTIADNEPPEDSTDKSAHDANAESTSNLHGDSKTTMSHNSVKDSRPTTSHCPVFRSKKLECKSAGAVKTAVRQIQLAEHRKRVKSASDKTQETYIQNQNRTTIRAPVVTRQQADI